MPNVTTTPLSAHIYVLKCIATDMRNHVVYNLYACVYDFPNVKIALTVKRCVYI